MGGVFSALSVAWLRAVNRIGVIKIASLLQVAARFSSRVKLCPGVEHNNLFAVHNRGSVRGHARNLGVAGEPWINGCDASEHHQ